MSAGEISADAITGDLRTQGNSLSFWQCGIAEQDKLEEAALAIAAGRDSIDCAEPKQHAILDALGTRESPGGTQKEIV